MRKTLTDQEIHGNILRHDHRDLQWALAKAAERKRIVASNAAWEEWVGSEKYWEDCAAAPLRGGDWMAP